jgi:hypothetical protein
MNKADDAIHDPFIIDVVDDPISSSTGLSAGRRVNQLKASSVPGKPEIQ